MSIYDNHSYDDQIGPWAHSLHVVPILCHASLLSLLPKLYFGPMKIFVLIVRWEKKGGLPIHIVIDTWLKH